LEEEKVVDSALAKFLECSNFIPCTGCRYCMDCPAGVDIPKNFKHYNSYAIGKREKSYVKHYLTLESESAHSCVGCGQCALNCPQHIDTPARMSEIRQYIDSVKEKYKA
jgi:predicted aldo/keto reductase-like oxidoreductase